MPPTMFEYLRAEDDHDHGDAVDDPILAKVVAMCVLFLASFIMGVLPAKLNQWFHWETDIKKSYVVSHLLAFGGGVLLCTTFIHLLPEVSENIEALQEDGIFPDIDVHMSSLLMCAGFFLMYLVEEVVHSYLHYRQKKSDMDTLFRKSLSIRRGTNTHDCDAEHSTVDLVKTLEPCEHLHSHEGHSHVIIEDSIVQSIRGMLIVLALSVHELFEGLAVGLESSSSNVWYMFGGVSAHKLVIAFCVGVELLSAKTKTVLSVIYVFVFAFVSPLGIGIGILISDQPFETAEVWSVTLQGLASGTLLYVVFFEILQQEKRTGLRQYCTIILGFAIMLGLKFLGIGAGIILSGHENSQEDLTSVILQGMAAGTLLYVVFFEVLARERSNSHKGVWQLLAIIVGFSVMLFLQIATGHEHSHGGHEHGVEITDAHTPTLVQAHNHHH